MISPAPLLIVLGTILALLAVQRLLSRAEPQNHAPPASPIPSRPRGRPLLKGLSVTGLDERGVEQLQVLITQGDIMALATFLAFNRPGFVELDQFLAQLQKPDHQQATLSKDTTAGIAEKPAPAGLRLSTLTPHARQQLHAYKIKSPRLITRELMSRFGGHEFSNYFAHYAAREHTVTLHVTPFDPDRKIMEALAKSGIARKGRLIPLAQRLTALKMSQLRQMAKDLNLNKKFNRKDEATTFLADVPGSAVLLSMQYVVDDLFALKPIEEDCNQINREWAFLVAYAELLVTLKFS